MTTKTPPQLKPLEKFHGHLGPYAVVGYKMGLLAREKLGEGWMTSVVEVELKKPQSCIIDGIQVATSCTFGKRNIEIRDKKIPKASFNCGGKRLTLRIKDNIWEKIEREMSKEKEFEHSLFYYNLPNEELFEVLDL